MQDPEVTEGNTVAIGCHFGLPIILTIWLVIILLVIILIQAF
jgi:uncharacterized membrane protein